MPALPLALTLFLSLPGVSAAEIYRWTDEKGTVHFTDSSHGIPAELQRGVKTLDDRLPPPAPPTVIPLVHAEMGYVVLARVNGSTQVNLLVDTGASSTVLSPGAVQRLGLATRNTPPVILQTANGKVQAEWVEVYELEVGGRRAGPLRVVVHEAVPKADGLLGMDFLGRFRVEIETAGPGLVLTPR